MKEEKIIPSIYRIDENRVKSLILADKKPNLELSKNNEAPAIKEITIPEYIKKYQDTQRKKGLSSQKKFTQIFSDKVDNYSIFLYSSKSKLIDHGLANFFDIKKEEPSLKAKYPNAVAFFINLETCYVISIGQGQNFFNQCIDTNFPFEIAKRIMKPKLNSSEKREISGNIYGEKQVYRNASFISTFQNLGTVWKKIDGTISDETRNSDDFVEIFDPDNRDIRVQVGDSITINKSISLKGLIKLLNWFNKILKQSLSNSQEEAFEFLNSLTEIKLNKNKELISQLDNEACANILNFLKNNEEVDLDFSNSDFIKYQNATDFYLKTSPKNNQWDYPPKAQEVIESMNSAEMIDENDEPEELKEKLKAVYFESRDSDGNLLTRGNIMDHLHGEITYNNKTYFRIDKKWYRVEGYLINMIDKRFKEILESDYFSSDSQLNSMDNCGVKENEGDYNKLYLDKNDWLVCDHALLDNIELADLIHWTDNKIYIFHNKVGFGASTRDVCSQAYNSMEILDRIKKSNDDKDINSYYDKIKKANYDDRNIPITKDEFFKKINGTNQKNIIYVIGYISQGIVRSNNKSNIAKFETIGLCDNCKQFDFKLEFKNIKKITVSNKQ